MVMVTVVVVTILKRLLSTTASCLGKSDSEAINSTTRALLLEAISSSRARARVIILRPQRTVKGTKQETGTKPQGARVRRGAGDPEPPVAGPALPLAGPAVAKEAPAVARIGDTGTGDVRSSVVAEGGAGLA